MKVLHDAQIQRAEDRLSIDVARQHRPVAQNTIVPVVRIALRIEADDRRVRQAGPCEEQRVQLEADRQIYDRVQVERVPRIEGGKGTLLPQVERVDRHDGRVRIGLIAVAARARKRVVEQQLRAARNLRIQADKATIIRRMRIRLRHQHAPITRSADAAR